MNLFRIITRAVITAAVFFIVIKTFYFDIFHYFIAASSNVPDINSLDIPHLNILITATSFAFSGFILAFMLGLLRQFQLSRKGSVLFIAAYITILLTCFWWFKHQFSTSLLMLPMVFNLKYPPKVAELVMLDTTPLSGIGFFSGIITLVLGQLIVGRLMSSSTVG